MYQASTHKKRTTKGFCHQLLRHEVYIDLVKFIDRYDQELKIVMIALFVYMVRSCRCLTGIHTTEESDYEKAPHGGAVALRIALLRFRCASP